MERSTGDNCMRSIERFIYLNVLNVHEYEQICMQDSGYWSLSYMCLQMSLNTTMCIEWSTTPGINQMAIVKNLYP